MHSSRLLSADLASIKDKVKEDRQRAIREKQEAIEREKREKEEAEQKIKEEQERKAKEEREKEKKERDIAKKAMAQQRRRLKKMADEAGHWTENPRDKLTEMERIERICIGFSVDQLRELCDKVEQLTVASEVVQALDDAEIMKKEAAAGVKLTKEEEKNKENEKQEKETWTSEEIQLLVKASNTFPSGTVDRWTQIAEYINEHRKNSAGLPPKTEKQVIKQCKAVQTMNVKLPSTTQNQLGTALPDEDNWSATEQKLLEESIKRHKSSDPERWEKISTDVGTKSKKACIRRFKYLVQMVKNKK
uniref:Myb-like domain-containing protein n=1 Tax=Caenorhabditis japonica TaxID=281687 RepID=A0A8R1HP29_CAEJA